MESSAIEIFRRTKMFLRSGICSDLFFVRQFGQSPHIVH